MACMSDLMLCPHSGAASFEGCMCRAFTSHSERRGCPSLKTPSNAVNKISLHFLNSKAAPDGSFVVQHIPKCIVATLLSVSRIEHEVTMGSTSCYHHRHKMRWEQLPTCPSPSWCWGLCLLHLLFFILFYVVTHFFFLGCLYMQHEEQQYAHALSWRGVTITINFILIMQYFYLHNIFTVLAP